MAHLRGGADGRGAVWTRESGDVPVLLQVVSFELDDGRLAIFHPDSRRRVVVR